MKETCSESPTHSESGRVDRQALIEQAFDVIMRLDDEALIRIMEDISDEYAQKVS